MDSGSVALIVGYVLFLFLSRGVLGGAARALTDWGRSTDRAPRTSTSG